MTVDGERLIISMDMDLDEVVELKEFIAPRIEYIDEIVFEENEMPFVTSSLLQLLVSVKRTRPDMVIPFLDGGDADVKPFGKQYWKLHE